MDDFNYLEINKKSWNDRVDVHVASDFYDVQGFLEGKNSLQSIEMDLLGDLRGKSVLHLQCHFGQDSISLSRLGAVVTAVDFSDHAIKKGRELAALSEENIDFICSNVYDLPNHLTKNFDMVFTSYGTIGWLPDLSPWAKVISHFLKPGGRFIFVEFHPVVWMFDDGFEKLTYDYFNTGPIREVETGTYADKNSKQTFHHITWNHSLGDILSSLLENNLVLKNFMEYDYSPFPCFRNVFETSPGKYRIKNMNNKIPMVFSLVAQSNK